MSVLILDSLLEDYRWETSSIQNTEKVQEKRAPLNTLAGINVLKFKQWQSRREAPGNLTQRQFALLLYAMLISVSS